MKKDRVEALGEVACDTLQRMVRELLSRKPGGHLVESRIEAIDLRFVLGLFGEASDTGTQGRDLTRLLDRLLDDAVQQAAAFRPGHAWCHRCKEVTCEHSRPPTGRHVFAGYAQTGTPRWIELGQLCLDRKHPAVDRLFDDPPAFVTLIQTGRELQGNLIHAFRQPTYSLLGQVIAGFYTVRARADEGRGVLALTVQVAASRSRSGAMRLGLNLLGRAPSGGDLSTLWERHDDLPWHRAVSWAQSALESVQPRAGRPGRRGGAERRLVVERRVEGILQGLARRLESDRRSRGRRTNHAEKRHASRERPTRKAIDDAREADSDGVLIDERSGAVVILGDRGRTHFFTPEGQHVSSVRYSKDAIARKVRVERWRRALGDELAAFRGKLPA